MAQPCTTLLSISPQVLQLREERGSALVTDILLKRHVPGFQHNIRSLWDTNDWQCTSTSN